MHSKVLFITPVPLHKTMDKHNCMIFLVQAINNKSFVGLAPVHLYELGSDEPKTILNLVLTSFVFIWNFCCRSLTSSKLAQDTSEMIIWQQRLKLRKPEKNSGTDLWIPDAQNTVGIWNLTLRNLETFKLKTFPKSDFKWYGFPRVPIIWKPDHSKSGHVCPDEVRDMNTLVDS